jgi:hypothetical protein
MVGRKAVTVESESFATFLIGKFRTPRWPGAPTQAGPTLPPIFLVFGQIAYYL